MSGASRVVGQNGIVVSRRRGKDTRQNAAIVNSLQPLQRWFPTYVLSVLVAASRRSIFLTRVPRRDAAAGCSPRPWVAITSPLGRRGPRVASVPSIWSEPLHAMWRAERHGRAKRASIRIGELYTTGPTSVLRATREG